MPSSLSKNGGLTLFVTHMKIISFSCALRACFVLFKIKKSKIKKVYQDSNPRPSQV